MLSDAKLAVGRKHKTSQNNALAGAKNREAGFAGRFLRQHPREPALREPGRQQPREQEQEQRLPVCARPPPTCRLLRHAAPAGAIQLLFPFARSSSLATVRAIIT